MIADLVLLVFLFFLGLVIARYSTQLAFKILSFFGDFCISTLADCSLWLWMLGIGIAFLSLVWFCPWLGN